MQGDLKDCIREELKIPVKSQTDNIMIYIAPLTAYDSLYEIPDPNPGQSPYHLQESANYEYRIISDGKKTLQFSRDTVGEIVQASRLNPNSGTIKTGIYVGTLTLKVVEVDKYGEREIGEPIRLEIRSRKMDYEKDYTHMLEEITGYYTDLVLQQSSPVSQQLEVDQNTDSKTLYQRFAFLRSIIDGEQFREAIQKIEANPVKRWAETTIHKNIVGVRRLSRKNIRQIVTSHDRVKLPEPIRIGEARCGSDAIDRSAIYLDSVPRTLEVDYKRDTIDNRENQFIKFVLNSFASFCRDLRGMKNASDRLRAEAGVTVDKIENHLDSQFFRHISSPSYLSMNSPVLQSKEGYREVLRAWILFDLAAKLNWKGGDDVYEAGKKNVATLYEYWLFFKLKELVGEFFQLEGPQKEKLVEADPDGINLHLKQGKMRVISGVSKSDTRNLNVSFYYNRTFSKPNGGDEVHKAGSWTMAMRPDYTLSIWPGNIGQEQAEREELITHIHFDAKYRLNKIILEDAAAEKASGETRSELLNEEKHEQEKGIYKRADLLKMHAYKDAIRRTGGAYVLYPGSESKYIEGFHEIIPGLGAFSIRPTHWEKDSYELRCFLAEVKANMLNRISDRERLSYFTYDVHKEPQYQSVMERLPEPEGSNRDFLPEDATVIVGYYRDPAHLEWIEKNLLYNVRAGDIEGSMQLNNDLIDARYLLLYNDREENVSHLLRLKKGGPKVLTREHLLAHGYPHNKREPKKTGNLYFVFSIAGEETGAGVLRPLVEKEMKPYYWELNDIPITENREPTVMKLIELLKTKHVKSRPI